MEDSESKESSDDYRKRSLKSDRFFQVSLVVVFIGIVLITIGDPYYYSVPPEPTQSSFNLYDFGTFILLLGIILLVTALGNYVSKRMSDQDFWWVIKTGPFPQPT